MTSHTAGIDTRVAALGVAAAVALGASAAWAKPSPTAASAQCDVTGSTWSYLAPEAFEGVAWDNEAACLYAFEAGSSRSEFAFSSQPGCLTDPWRKATGLVTSSNGRTVTMTFDTPVHNTVHLGWVTPDCQYIDVDDGGMYIRGQHPMDMAPHEWLRVATAWVMRAAVITFADGTRHLTPGVPKPTPVPFTASPKPNDGYYVGQWMRDGFYGISNGWPLVNETAHAEYAQSAEWMFSHARADGMLAEMCAPSGHCVYGQSCPDQPPAPNWQGCQTLDTGAFAVKFAAHLWNNMNDTAGAAFYKKWLPTLTRAMDATAKDPKGSGLLWSNTSRPQVGYGFQDAEVKSGNVLYSSILFWNASRLIADMATRQGDDATASRMTAQAARIQTAATAQLWNSTLGVFMASTGMESDNIDVWGNAMAGAMGFATAEQSDAIFQFFKTREADIFYEGQVREIPFPQQWTDAAAGSIAPRATVRKYQNGGFWATPHHHVLPFLAMHDRGMACRLLNDTIASFRGHGIWEWVGPLFPATIVGAPGYTASAADTYFASEHMRCWEP